MTTVLERPKLVPPPPDRPPTRRASAGGWLRRHRRSLGWLTPLFVLAGVVFAIGMTGSPQRIDDEGTYTAQAYAVEYFGQLAHYTFWYDHPPLGWLQLAGWTSLTGAFDRWDIAVFAGREFMLVAHLVSVVLLWALGRRLGLSRPAAAAAVLVYSLSPLAVQFHRTVYLDNIATPWVLAAFLLAQVRHRQLAAYSGSAVCMAVAILSKETYLLLLPALLWMLWRGAHPETRRYTLSAAGSLFVLCGLGYVLLALIKGEAVPGSDHVSLFDGLKFQLAGRSSSGSVFDPSSLTRHNIGMWVALDPVLSVLAPVSALVALRNRAMRPIAATLIFLLLFMLRPGYLPVPYVIALLPLAALTVAGSVDVMLRRGPRVLGAAAVLVAVVAAAVAAPLWFTKLRGLALADLDQPLQSAQAWVEDNVPHNRRVLVDDAAWVDLVRAGFPRDNVVWYYKVDTDTAVEAKAPGGWRDYDFALVTQSLRTSTGTGAFPTVDTALANSHLVASFGAGDARVDVRRIDPAGAKQTTVDRDRDVKASSSAGVALAKNSALTIAPAARDLLTGGRVDPRIVSVLALAAAEHRLSIRDFPAATGDAPDTFRRSMVIDSVDGRPVTDATAEPLTRLLDVQAPPYRPAHVELADGRLTVTYLSPSPTGLLPAG